MEQQELYLLIIRHLNAETTTEEELFLTGWLEESNENRQTFSALQEIWNVDKQPANNEVMNAGLNNVKYKIAASRRNIYRKYAAAAAMIAVVVISCAFFFSHQGNAYIETVSGPGQVMHLQLADGTLVDLAPGSRIRYAKNFGEKNRDITLYGEAFFEVRKDAHEPFSVLAGKLSVRVLGTKFNVSDTAVSLVEGKVQVIAQQHAYNLQPGQQLYYNASEDRCYQRNYDVEAVTGWASALLVFRNESFASAAAKIEKMYDVKIIFADPETANYMLFAKFSNKPLRYVLDMIKAANDIDYTIKEKNVYISRIK
ncbi:FecR family protein [Chitinophaga sp. CF118]|uniref:FecR family protein n=1 Tax=Chitinophaga sp. CF118 TaxID=1884367 RepID=UPI0008EF234B|nr:FecR domain-containing protein [Chitinophaga sp. CF118]SFD09312.1 FecR family protein [Chitinophaga sp. CF118]